MTLDIILDKRKSVIKYVKKIRSQKYMGVHIEGIGYGKARVKISFRDKSIIFEDDFLNNIKAAIKWSKYGGIYLGEYFNYSGLLKVCSGVKFKELAKGINNVGEIEFKIVDKI